MSLSVNNNAAALNTYRNLTSTQGALGKSLEKLSSGYRINRAADDAAGLAISEGLRSQVNGLTQASRNAQDGINVVQTAEGALNESTSILQRMRTLAVQAANGSNNTDSVSAIQGESDQLAKELTRIAGTTSFNGTKLLDGSATANALKFQVGANGGDTLTVKISSDAATAKGFDATTLGVATGADEATTAALVVTDAGTIGKLDAAIKTVSSARAGLGATQNRFEHTINNLNVSVENLTASESSIRDTDMASEMVKFTSKQILSQAGTAMLAQAKSLPQSILSLLQN